MSARQIAFRDIKNYLTPIADSEDLMRKKLGARWSRFIDDYIYYYDKGYSMRITHFKELLKIN